MTVAATAAAAKKKAAKASRQRRQQTLLRADAARTKHTAWLRAEAVRVRAGRSPLDADALQLRGLEVSLSSSLVHEPILADVRRTSVGRSNMQAENARRRARNAVKDATADRVAAMPRSEQLAWLLEDRAETYGTGGVEQYGDLADVLLLGYQRGLFYTVYHMEGAGWHQLRAVMARGGTCHMPAPVLRE